MDTFIDESDSRRKPNRSNPNQNNSDERKTYLNSSLENIPFYRAHYDDQITEEQRKQLILNELNLVKKEVETKSYETQFKANCFGFLNTATSLIILISAAVIVGLQSGSNCIEIPVIVLSSIIFVLEGVHKLFRLGPQGMMYKYTTVQMKKIGGQVRDYMYSFHRYNSDQLLALIGQLRAQYDDLDLGLYKTSVAGHIRYNANLDIEQGGGGNFEIPQTSNSNLNLNTNLNPNLNTPFMSQISNNSTPQNISSPHVHIHIDQSPRNGIIPAPFMPEKSVSNSILVVTDNNKLSVDETPISSNREGNLATPLQVPSGTKRSGRSNSVNNLSTNIPNNIPTIEIPPSDTDSEDKTLPVKITIN